MDAIGTVDVSSARALPWRRVALLVSAVAAVALRCVDLAAIPGWFTDEGFWAMPPRDFVLFGRWAVGSSYPYFHQYLSPLYSALLVVDFRLLGPGILQARFLSALLGFLTVLMTARLGRRLGPPGVASLAALAVACDGSLILTNRSAILESLETLLLVTLAFAALGTGGTRRAALAGLAGLAALTKLLSAYAAPVIVVHTWWKRGRGDALRDAAALGVGFLLAGLVFGGLALGDREHFLAAWGHELAVRAAGPPRGEGALALTLGYFVTREPILLLALGITSIWKVARREIGDAERFLGLWLLVGIAAMGAQGYAPDRYFEPLVPFAWLWVFLAIDDAFPSGKAVRSAPLAGLGLLLVQVGFTATSFVGYYYVLGHRDPAPVEAAAWIDDNVARDQRVLAPLRLVVSTRVPALGVESLPDRLTPTELEAMRVDYVVVGPDTRSNPNSRLVEGDHQAFRLAARFGEIAIYRAAWAGPSP